MVLSVEGSGLGLGEIFKLDWVGNIEGWVECGEVLDWAGANLLLRSPRVSIGCDKVGGGPRIDGGELWDLREEEDEMDWWNRKMDS